jgi:ADP-glucose type glycogen/starch synthase
VVTNHTGIESALLRDHPDWFVQLPHPPYPGYRFTGPDLSEDPEYAIQIEDGYYDHTEAAVVCRYQQRRTGEVRFIYHGNDGTHLPWNDTVQLNYLLAEVREAMIRLIIDVARRFRIIRFDAAMTLAKKHFQRLWYPLPGAVDGVPSRSDYAMTYEEFNRHFPVEFWRELVDRIQIEAPDTLLVAEAFWLMEGYFVRTLGMHRVYNSAFMNMLKNEENGKYRETLKNILAFDPAILQRFVNFMSNPDEKPAIEQFGSGDKYFCVATLLATMPGLPMFGHGQVEGFHEKYGMEYLAPRWDEQPDQNLLQRHQQQIFPLLRKRALFSGAESFQLYDFVSAYGVEDDVFVYSNSYDGQPVLILCNNSPKPISGRIGQAVPMVDKEGIPVGQACGFDLSAPFVLLTDVASGRQSLQRSNHLAQGGAFDLEPYCHRVLTDFTPLADSDGRWQLLWERHGSATRRNLWLDHAALLLETSWETAHALLKMKPTGVSQKSHGLVNQLVGYYRDEKLVSLDREAVLEILCHALFPQAALQRGEIAELGSLLSEALRGSDQTRFRFLERFFNRQHFRSLVGCHYYDYIDWFEQAPFESLCLLILQFEAALCREQPVMGTSQLAERVIPLVRQLQRLLRFAARVGYRVDALLQRLDTTRIEEKVIPADRKRGKRILFVASEATPFAKTGGLADVVGSLPRALRQLGHDVQVVIPCYRVVERGGIALAKSNRSLEITLQGRRYRGSLKQTVYDGVPYWFIDTPELFDREEIYGTASGDYPDNGLRFGYFSRAVLEMAKLLDFRPDVIHLHDWQTGLIPALLKTDYATQDFYRETRTQLTIHNLGYQGMLPRDFLRTLELPAELGSSSALEYYGRLSLLKGAIVFSDVITTVSPSYCHEIQGADRGHGFDGLLRSRGKDLYGIINGLDQRIWNPRTDRHLSHHYSRENLRNKGLCKAALQKELQLDVVRDRPIIAVISRLDPQKGIDLLEAIWTPLLERNVQFILLGSGSQEQMAFWQQQQGRHPGQVSINLTFNEALSHRIYAAADLLLVPSRYEPCGLTQMIALTYGVLPVVRRTGGLADTVVDLDEDPRGYGFVFDHPDPQELLQSIDRGLNLYGKRRRWLTVVKRGMACDFSWKNSAEQYQKLYRQMTK